MKAKICYMNEIHRVSKVPETLEGFNELVASIFKERLPTLWSLQYVDSDGDNIILADSKDFEEFQKFGSSGATGASVIKVFVKGVNGMDVSQMKSEQEEDYQIIGAPEVEKIEKSIEVPKVEESVQVELPKVEESVQVDEPKVEVKVEEKQEEEEVDPRVEKDEEEEDPRVEKEDEPMVAEKVEEKVEEPIALEKLEEQVAELEKKLEEQVAVEEQVEEQKKEEELSDILNSSARSIELIGDKKILVELDMLEQLMGSALEKSLPKFIQKTTEELSKKEKEKEKEKVELNPWAVQKKKIVNKVVHYGVRCNGCYSNPIIGFRYKCTICPDFDYCEECENTKEHPHDFIKMKKHTFHNEKKVSFANPGILKRREVPKKKPEEDEVQLIKGPENDYFKALKEKAEKLQKCFPKIDFELLLAYVNGAPDDMSLEELIENFKH